MEMTQFLQDDLARMDDLSINSIQKCLRARYERDLIYTNVSDILIAINPRKELKIYDEKTHDKYHADKYGTEVEPHIFQIASTAYRRMRENDANQVIIVSGESGAGKTESTKHMVKHMVHMSQKADMELHEKIVKINPLLEAFGNAKTIMNDNSSRYAKYLEISFKDGGELAGAVVRDYMLEKSRVVHQNDGEGNFHIFYALFAGCHQEALDDLFLNEPADRYRIMQSDPINLGETEKYKQMYYESMDILQKINVNSEILQAMLAAVILISEIEFDEDNRGASQIVDAATFAHAAILLNLDEITFGEALITSKRKVRDDYVATHKTVKQANDGRDALAKMLYERIFGWLVRMINQDLHPNRLGSSIAANIGILDIAGFEKLQNNSFEQLCINLVNEKLQSFMNRKIFTMELEIYKEEGIQLDGINFKNNDELLAMFETPKSGVLAILDENSNTQHASDVGFVQQLKTKFGKHELFIQPPGDRPIFCIQHFAALVSYNAEGFLEKNRDRLNDELVQVMRESSDEFIADLFTIKRGPTGTISMEPSFQFRASRRGVPVMLPGKPKQLKPTPQGAALAAELGKSLKKKFGTVQRPSEMTQITPGKKHGTLVSFFQNSLMQLLEKLGDGDPFFVRCIKANSNLRADDFDEAVVMDQLRYNGLAEIAKIRKMGFAVRKLYSDFFNRYRGLFPLPPLERQSDVNQSLLLLVPSAYHRDFRCGKTRVFMTSELNDWFGRLLRCRQKTAAQTVTRCMRKVAEIKKEVRRQEAERKRPEEIERRRREKEMSQSGGLKSTLRSTSTKPLGASSRTVTNGGSEPSSSGSSSSSSSSGGYDMEPPANPLGSTAPRDGRFGGSFRPPSPVSHIDEEHMYEEEKEEEEKKKEKETKKTETAFWDVCQIIARERKIRDVDEDRGLQVIKVVTYILLFCILLWCAVAQKLSLMVLVSPQFDRTENRSESKVMEHSAEAAARHILLTIAILIPYCLIFLSSVFKWMFGNLPLPSASTFFLCLIVEVMHSIGLCILAFIVLPEIDIVRGIFLLSGVAIIPAILFPVCASNVKVHKSRERQSSGKKLAVFALNILTVLLQFGYIPVVLLTDHFIRDSKVDNEVYDIVLFVVSMIFVSCTYWENFVDDRFCGRTNQRGCWRKFILKAKFDLQEARPVISCCTTFFKIGLTILFSWIIKTYHPENDSETGESNRGIDKVTFSEAFEKLGELPIANSAAIITLTLSAFVGHYVGYTACKLKLQKFSFNLPLILSTPLAIVLAAVDCSGIGILVPFTEEKIPCRAEEEFQDTAVHYVSGIVVWVSLYWLCRHIFYPDIERLAKTERLFMNPFYCGILFEQNMILNRRRHTRKVHKEIKNDKVYYRLSEYNSKVNIEGEEEDDVASQTDSKKDNEDIYASDYQNPKFRDAPMIYACATMWHETKYEMLQLMKSLFRMDRDQCIRRHAEEVFQKEDKDFYDFEAHILFDDAMTLNDDEEMVPNDFVKLLVNIMDEAASCVYEKATKIKAPYKVPTPYGGQLIFTMPGDNFLFIHLKDKAKIRHRKRWSQVMYMYYLLGFRIVRMCQETVSAALNEGKINELIQWEPGTAPGAGIGRSHIFQAFDDQVLKKASNTFLLALDGDVDFSPGAVRLLLDRMRKSEKVGAACGRIHPIGTGPVVWFQKFEYAIAHWLQKATEHVLGCVLCSPGCFSMFRGSALMDDNVMKKYTILPTEAAHHLMYDQGEDRWLCTLLLQQGYRVDYAAGSDAFTYAPEGFAEFFNQRRRWMPSTVFNIIDLLADYKNTVYVNSNISMLYILYQGALLMSTIVGPATVLMMIAGANMVVFKVTVIWGYVIALAPAFFYFITCFYVKSKTQIQIAEVLTGLYSFVMMIVLVGTIVTAAQESPFHPSVIFLGFLVVAFTFSAFLHPKEWSCIIFGALYFLLIPTGFLLLNIYSLCNLHVVSWGTREVPKKKTKAEQEEEKRQAEEKKKKKKERGFFGKFFPTFPTKEFKDMISKLTESQNTKKEDLSSSETNKLLKEMNEHLKDLVEQKNKPIQSTRQVMPDEETKTVHISADEPVEFKPKGILKHPHTDHQSKKHAQISESVRNIDDDSEETIYDRVKRRRNDLVNPAWAECKELGNGKVIPLASEELKFWDSFVKKYLEPLTLTDDQKKNTAKGLIELRNNIALGMAMINLLWIAINFMFQFESPTTIPLTFTGSDNNPDSPDYLEENQEDSDKSETADNIIEVDVLGLLFIFFYLTILLLQFVGMIIHRWGTFQHLVSVTKLKNPFPMADRRARQRSSSEEGTKDIDAKEAREIIDNILKEPLPDYSDDSGAEEEFEKEVEEELQVLQKTGSRYRVTVTQKGIGATSRRLGDTVPDLGRSGNNALSKSARYIKDGLQATMRKYVSAPKSDALKRGMQHEAYKAKDKYVDRPLPPVRQRRLNLGPGRSELATRLQEKNPGVSRYFKDSNSDGPLIPEDDNIYDKIGSKGTVSRQIGKRLKLCAKSYESMESHSNGPGHRVVSFENSGRPTSTPGQMQTHHRHHHHYRRYDRY
ncbi:uncharacterized protein LOC123560719 isoform X2 [Mercenaria mercenaria]|uniref:uncharacterized protein LOC123560719 isoform X2 n=1 Tax=Mercenaria mercenaria TaxID=6596 RepID=UPI00234F5323|nr:uncharacterized protein LOC123560719 isoform X2 [Mercenaria mercenaria]XP_053409097.1 uncharacterized protein LOC123560719 isoform X2 [Mercenaria mercenaria]